MNMLIKLQPEGKLIRRLAPQIYRSSMSFVGLCAITYWLLIHRGVVVSSDTAIDATKFCMSVTFISCLARFCYQSTFGMKSDARILFAQFSSFWVVIIVGINVAGAMARFIPGGLFSGERGLIAFCAVLGMLIFDSIYNFMLDCMQQK